MSRQITSRRVEALLRKVPARIQTLYADFWGIRNLGRKKQLCHLGRLGTKEDTGAEDREFGEKGRGVTAGKGGSVDFRDEQVAGGDVGAARQTMFFNSPG